MKYFLATALVLSGLLSSARVNAAPPEPLVDQVRKAIDNGKKFLRDQQVLTNDNQGHWEVDINSKGRPGGWTALALLALLNAGEKPDSPVIRRGLKYLREKEVSDTYVLGLQTMVLVEVGDPQDKARIQRNVDWLVKSRVMKGRELQGWGYSVGSQPRGADNSNTQYAVLGLWAGKSAGANIDREVWESIRDFYVRTQQSSGSWHYADYASSASFTMTVAGLCGLHVVAAELNPDRQQLQNDGVALRCGIYEEDKALAKAMESVSTNFKLELAMGTFYNVYGLERAGRLTGQRFLGDHDWYREGCQYLVQHQHDDGSWYEGQLWDKWPVVSTSFALLFLSKGRTPVLISKLQHGSPDRISTDWNRKHSDLRNLTEYASKELFKRQPLAWQIFNGRQVQAINDEEIRNLTGELLQSPIAYFNGHNSPFFTEREIKMLRYYVDQGGFILAEACCGSPQFDAGFRRLMRDLFPDNELVPLGPNHPIWQAHSKVPPNEFKLLGIEMGCKTVVVYSPQPISGWWEANQKETGRGQLAFRLGANIIAYATGLELPKPRGFHIEVAENKQESKIPRGYLKVAQLRQGERWRSAAKGIQNLMLDLRKRARLDVSLESKELYPNDRDILDYKFMYMHGRDEFEFKNVELLRANLETGGLLFADACCGKKDFDRSFRDFMKHVFPDKKLEPIPVFREPKKLDDLFSRELNGTPLTTVRCRRERRDSPGVEAEYQEAAPELEGIKIGNRWAVIYSKYDIGCALEKHQSPDCLGYDHESALKLAGAAVLYALQR